MATPIYAQRGGVRLPECAGMSLDEDERLGSDAEVERFLKSVVPGPKG
jgi:hypothetical protein